MGRSVNKVFLVGNMGRDPDVRFTSTGQAVANMSLATDESYNDKQTGQKVEQAEWHRLVAFGKLAEIVQVHVKKGSKLHIEGRIRTREWEKDGEKRYTSEIVVSELLMLDPPAHAPQAPAPTSNHGYAQPPQQSPQPIATPHNNQFPDDDVPF